MLWWQRLATFLHCSVPEAALLCQEQPQFANWTEAILSATHEAQTMRRK